MSNNVKRVGKKIYGTDKNDSIYTDAEHRVVYGGDGDDLISATKGNDILYGQGGDDLLFAPGGGVQNVRTTLVGGAGNDLFKFPTSNNPTFSNTVVIEDYHKGDNIYVVKDQTHDSSSINLDLHYYSSGSEKVTEIFNDDTNDLVATVFGSDYFFT